MQHREGMCVCMRACVCVCSSNVDEEGSWVFTSRALAVVWTAMYLTGYFDYLTGFHEPLSPPYSRHMGLKNV